MFSGQKISSALVFSGTRTVNPDVMVCAHDVTLGHPLILREYHWEKRYRLKTVKTDDDEILIILVKAKGSQSQRQM